MREANVARLIGRVVLSVIAAAVAVLIAAVGVSAASASIDESQPQGGLELVPAAGLDGTNQVPGSVIERVLTLRNAGTATYRVIDFASTASAPAAGLRLQLVGCDSGWQPAAAGHACAGGERVLSTTTVGATVELTGSAALRSGGSDSLLVRLTLPKRAGVSARVTYSAVGR